MYVEHPGSRCDEESPERSAMKGNGRMMIKCDCCGDDTEKEDAWNFTDEFNKVCPGCRNCINAEIIDIEEHIAPSTKTDRIRTLAIRLVRLKLKLNTLESGV